MLAALTQNKRFRVGAPVEGMQLTFQNEYSVRRGEGIALIR
jgi:hypothetical protein